MLNKTLVTKQLLDQLATETRPSLDQALKDWWINIRDNGGMRLSEAGYLVFDKFDLDRYEHRLDNFIINASFLIVLDKKLSCPYYLQLGKKARLVMFGSREAMMLKLYGDIERYLDMLSRQ